MRILRLALSIALAAYMTGAGQLVRAQDVDSSPFSLTLAPVQYANVKGNIGNFEALNWMPNGATEGIDVSFLKDINKDISLSVDGSEFSNDNGKAQLTLKDGDLAFLKIDYNAFRKYYDNTGGVYPGYGSVNGAKANSPDLQMDISFFKIEAGVGPITDPFLDVVYEHDSKDGDKSLEQWAKATTSLGTKDIAPSWESVDDTVDKVTLKEHKVFAGITMKADQTAEIDYNHNMAYMQGINNTGATNSLSIEDESPDAKLFGAGVRFEKWMLNDNTFAGLGYHYNHIHDTDLMQVDTQTLNSAGIVTAASETGWNFAHASEDDHVWVGNFNSNLTPNLAFITDARYEHMGSEGDSTYYSSPSSPTTVNAEAMENHQDHEGEHVELRYSGISHTSLYAEANMEQEKNWVWESFDNIASPLNSTSDFTINRLDRTQKNSWTVGGEVVPNRFFIFRTQVDQKWENNNYDTISLTGTPTDQTFLDALRINTIEEASSVTWKPYHWIQNSLKYQFVDSVYNPQASAEGASSSSTPPLPADGQYPITENHMLSSIFTYDITVQPLDSLLLMLTYSHAENYVRTIAASEPGGANNATYPYIPTFNSGDNSFLFSTSYSPTEYLTWTNTACYTISNNYVDFTNGVPYGSDFKMLNFTTGLDYSYHKWLKIGPKYEYAAYRDSDPSAGSGNYSANIFMLTMKFSW